MLRKSLVAATVLVAGAALFPAAADAASGYTVSPTEMRAGPDYDYPIVRTIRNDRRVDIYGCLNDWSFCDVGYRADRGWVRGDDLVVDYRSRRTRIVDAGPYVGIGFLSFSFGSYWDNYYRGRPFYRERGRWERHYHDRYKPQWGPRPGWRDGDRRDGRDRNDRRDDVRRDNDRRTTAPVTTPAPAPNRPGVIERGDSRQGVNDRARPANNERRDGNRPGGDKQGGDRGVDRTLPAPATPAPVPPTATPAPKTPPAATPGRGDGNKGNRPGGVEERGDRGDRGGAERFERPRETPQQQRENRGPRPQKAPPKPDEQDDRPGR